jgi:hypothetical protein
MEANFSFSNDHCLSNRMIKANREHARLAIQIL